MALSFIWSLGNFWPFLRGKPDDLGVSNALVKELPIPDHTKQFVFAIPEPDSGSVVYILCSQSLSARSVSDVECLIKALRPDVVLAHVGNVGPTEVKPGESGFSAVVNDPIPTSAFAVLKRCFVDRVNKEKYENSAANFVLQEIFGVGFHEHLFAAKKAAEEVGCSFFFMESPFVKYSLEDGSSTETEGENSLGGLVSSLAPLRSASLGLYSMRRFSLTDLQTRMLKTVSSSMNALASDTKTNSIPPSPVVRPESSYVAPPFAQSIYPLLEDLYSLFQDIPSMGRALAHTQKMLSDVSKGDIVDSQAVSEVYSLRIAVEGLRIALNSAGRLPIVKPGNSSKAVEAEFSELPAEDKAQILFAQAIRGQARKFKSTVAVVDASILAGLRKHWNTPVPKELEDLIGQVAVISEESEESRNHKKRLLYSSPVVAVGAGASAVLGVSSLSKAVPASAILKSVTVNLPMSMKIFLVQTQKVFTLAFGKSIGPSTLATRGLVSSVGKSSALKATLSAEKIRAITHGVIASAEKTSISAMRTSFYEIMRKRQVQPIRALPLATFGCSIATCLGLIVYGVGIECAAESLPSAPSIASLGRGIQSLHEVSQSVRQKDGGRIQKSIEALMYRLKKNIQ